MLLFKLHGWNIVLMLKLVAELAVLELHHFHFLKL